MPLDTVKKWQQQQRGKCGATHITSHRHDTGTRQRALRRRVGDVRGELRADERPPGAPGGAPRRSRGRRLGLLIVSPSSARSPARTRPRTGSRPDAAPGAPRAAQARGRRAETRRSGRRAPAQASRRPPPRRPRAWPARRPPSGPRVSCFSASMRRCRVSRPRRRAGAVAPERRAAGHRHRPTYAFSETCAGLSWLNAAASAWRAALQLKREGLEQCVVAVVRLRSDCPASRP